MITADTVVSKQLTEFGDALRADYGSRLARLVIYGSQARGDQAEEIGGRDGPDAPHQVGRRVHERTLYRYSASGRDRSAQRPSVSQLFGDVVCG